MNCTSKQDRTTAEICLNRFVFIFHSPVLIVTGPFPGDAGSKLSLGLGNSAKEASLPSQRTWRDVMAAGEVFECVELCLLFSNPSLQDFDSCFWE